ncbi:Mu transposase C-terminal domain-containing protein [Rheinheimera sp.]|uniref:Mu transposase C-terminal domain-containing protein n=1 Tax=Rheinheimera sp. TaxID=1869214 RepID=UPI00307E5822
MTNSFSASQIADALNVSSRTVRIRANKELWPCDLVTGRGGQISMYYLVDLPSDVAAAVKTHYKINDVSAPAIKGQAAAKLIKSSTELDQQINLDKKQSALKAFAGLTNKQKERAEAIYSILQAANQYANAGAKVAAWNKFVSDYNSRSVTGVESSVYTIKPKIAFSTLTRWESAYKKGGLLELAGKYVNTKGDGVIEETPELKSFCLAMLFEYPHVKGQALHEALESQFAGEFHIPTAQTCTRWLARWKAENDALYMSLFDPSAWQNKRMVAFGSKSAGIERINQMWEFDSTPADVMLADGRYSIVGVIDVATRRPMVVLKPTSNSEAIALLIRKAIIEWGLPETAVTDNGSDYTGVHISTVWDALGIKHVKTAPYSGWEKPFIERFFRTFAHGIAELCQGYIGHNVQDRQRINARLTFAERLLEKRKKGEERMALNVELTAEQFETFINQWIDHKYNHDRHSALGCSPFEKFTALRQQIRTIADPRVLDVLLAPVPGQKGFRTVTKGDGIQVERGSYVHPVLGAYVGERVFCRWNPNDIGKIYVFHALTAEFLCEAIDPETADQGVDLKAIAQEAKRMQREQLAEQRRTFKLSAKKYNVKGIAQQILEHKAGLVGNLTAFPKPTSSATSVTIEATTQALQQADKKPAYTPEQLSEFERRRAQLEVLENSAKPIFETDAHKARYLTELSQKTELPAVEKAWLHQFRRNNRAAAAMLDEMFEPIEKKGESL